MDTDDNKQSEVAVNKLLGKKQFVVSARETVYYETIVWATDADEAETIVYENGVETDCIIDGDGFEIYEVELKDGE